MLIFVGAKVRGSVSVLVSPIMVVGHFIPERVPTEMMSN